MTNYERIKNLSIEDMAKEIKQIANWDKKESDKANKIEGFYIDYLNQNDKNIDKEWIIGNKTMSLNGDVYGVPTCPECKEPTYSEERCPFCNQSLKDPINY